MAYDLLRTALSSMHQSTDPVLRARAENLIFEQRIGSQRIQAYCDQINKQCNSHQDWLSSHADYLNRNIHFSGVIYKESPTKKIPETFTAINRPCFLPAAVSSPLAEEQEIIRLINLSYVEDKTLFNDPTRLVQALSIYQGVKAKNEISITQHDSKGLLQSICDQINLFHRANSPQFAAFAEELKDEINSDEWPNLLRDRLGMTHLQNTPKNPSIPVMLMKYKVSEVVAEAKKENVVSPFAVPTFMDSELNEAFHPAPSQCNYGRALNLQKNPENKPVAAELIHFQFTYRPSHIFKIGFINRAHIIEPQTICKLREKHLSYLRTYSGSENFGEIPAGLLD